MAGQLQRARGHDGGRRQGCPQGHLLRVTVLGGLHTGRHSHQGDDLRDLEARHRHVRRITFFLSLSLSFLLFRRALGSFFGRMLNALSRFVCLLQGSRFFFDAKWFCLRFRYLEV